MVESRVILFPVVRCGLYCRRCDIAWLVKDELGKALERALRGLDGSRLVWRRGLGGFWRGRVVVTIIRGRGRLASSSLWRVVLGCGDVF